MNSCAKHGSYGGWGTCPHCEEEYRTAEFRRDVLRGQEQDRRERARADEQHAEAERERRDDEREEREREREQQEYHENAVLREQGRVADAAECRLELLRARFDALGTCEMCGQEFQDETRKEPALGKHWKGVLGQFADDGVCPRCYFDRFEREEVDWTRGEWRAHYEDRLQRLTTSAGAALLVADLADFDDLRDLAVAARDRMEAVEHERAWVAGILTKLTAQSSKGAVLEGIGADILEGRTLRASYEGLRRAHGALTEAQRANRLGARGAIVRGMWTGLSVSVLTWAGCVGSQSCSWHSSEDRHLAATMVGPFFAVGFGVLGFISGAIAGQSTDSERRQREGRKVHEGALLGDLRGAAARAREAEVARETGPVGLKVDIDRWLILSEAALNAAATISGSEGKREGQALRATKERLLEIRRRLDGGLVPLEPPPVVTPARSTGWTIFLRIGLAVVVIVGVIVLIIAGPELYSHVRALAVAAMGQFGPAAPAPAPAKSPTRISPDRIAASSQKVTASDRHPVAHAFDANPETAWSEGVAGSGAGEWIEATFAAPIHVTRIRFDTGWSHVSATHGDLFTKNAHFKTLRIEADGVPVQSVDVGPDERSVSISLEQTASRLRFVAVAVYPGKAWQDLSVSDIEIVGVE